MGTALDRVDIIDVGVDVFRVRSVVHNSHFDRNICLVRADIDHIVEEMRPARVDIANKLAQTLLGVELLLLRVAFFIGAKICKRDLQAGIQESEFAHTGSQRVIIIYGRRKYGIVGPKLLFRTAQLGFANYFYGIKRLALLIFLLVNLSVAKNLRRHMLRKGIYARNTDTVQTAGDLVRAFIKLTAGVKYGHNHFQRASVLFRVHIYGDTATIVLHNDRIVRANRDFNVRTIACQRLIYGVVDRLID